LIVLVKDWAAFKSFKGGGTQEAMPPLPVFNRWVRILRGLEVVKVTSPVEAEV
jgi:hypothetical protein